MKPARLVTQHWPQVERKIFFFFFATALNTLLLPPSSFMCHRSPFLSTKPKHSSLANTPFSLQQVLSYCFNSLRVSAMLLTCRCLLSCTSSRKISTVSNSINHVIGAFTYTSLWCVYTRSKRASGAIHFTGKRPCEHKALWSKGRHEAFPSETSPGFCRVFLNTSYSGVLIKQEFHYTPSKNVYKDLT